MSNDTEHYFGAYLEIEVSKVEDVSYVDLCENKHPQHGAKFCSQCGKSVKRTKTVTECYPYRLYSLLSDEFEDELHVITPQKMIGEGVIIANSGQGKGQWLNVTRYHEDGDPDTKAFPNDEQVAALKAELWESHRDVINLLISKSAVVEVTIKCGYVLNECN